MLGSAMVVLAPSILPGWALSTVLDGSSDRFRKALLAPALGLLLFYGVSGSLVLLDVWSPMLLAFSLLSVTRLGRRLFDLARSAPCEATPHLELARWVEGWVFGL